MQHSASATASPPSETSCDRRDEPARATSLAHDRERRAPAPRGRPSGSRSRQPAALLLELRARRAPGANGPTQRDRVALGARSPCRRHAGGVGELADHADDRRRVDRPLGALVVERDVAADDRHAERAAGGGDARRSPAMSCQAMCGFSGLPKFRQLVRPSGSAPDAGEVLRALEHGLDRARVRVARRRAGRCRRSTTAIAPVPPSGASDRHRGSRPRPRGARCASRRACRTARTPSAC